jgi:hypothetical protein
MLHYKAGPRSPAQLLKLKYRPHKKNYATISGGTAQYLRWVSYSLAGRVIGLRYPPGQDICSFLRVRTCSGAHSSPYPMDIGGRFPWDKAAEMWSWPTNNLIPRLKISGVTPLLPYTPSRRGAQLRAVVDLCARQTENPQILGATVTNPVGMATWRLKFVYPCVDNHLG